MSQQAIVRYLDSENKMLLLGASLARALRPGLAIYLQGTLGAGKTTLVRGLLRALGYSGAVKSPTYTLVESYELSGLHLYHFDFYRFSDPDEWEEGGFRDYFNEHSICLVEWPQMAEGLPEPDLRIDIALSGTGRNVTLLPMTPTGAQVVANL